MEQLLTYLQNDFVFYGLISAFVLVVLIIILQVFRKSRLKKRYKDLEIQLTTLRTIPLSFKVNKAVALARVNDGLLSAVKHSNDSLEEINSQFIMLTSLMSDTEDEILYGSLSKGAAHLEEISKALDELSPMVNDLNQRLDLMLEDEFEQRSEITSIKETFIQCKTFITTKNNELSLALDTLTLTVGEIEVMFESFESWMAASEFEKARLKMVEIHSAVDDLHQRIHTLPELIKDCKGRIPTMMEELSALYASCRAKNIPVEHLSIPKNLELISSTLKEDLSLLRNAIIEGVTQNNADRLKRLQQMKESCAHEVSAHDQVYALLSNIDVMFPSIDLKMNDLNHSLNTLKQRYQANPKTFDMIHHESAFEKIKSNLKDIEVSIKDHVPYSTMLSLVKESSSATSTLLKTLDDALNTFKSLKEDEDRIRKQLLKLHLIVNEIKVKIRKHRLPAISESYNGDLSKAKQMTVLISQLLEKDVIELPRLNQLTSEAIDYIYALYNNVNNIVGMVEMIESAIVFANKYRSQSPTLDSELNRVELSFRNGEYTLALNQALKAIEKLHPHSFEKLISNNAKSAQ
jgi:septation ring formation regulator